MGRLTKTKASQETCLISKKHCQTFGIKVGVWYFHTFFPFYELKKMNKRFISFCALGVICAQGYSQQNAELENTQVNQLEAVVVSDSRFELKRENSGKTIITITSEELQRNQGRSLAELINTKSGIEINGSRSNAGQ